MSSLNFPITLNCLRYHFWNRKHFFRNPKCQERPQNVTVPFLIPGRLYCFKRHTSRRKFYTARRQTKFIWFAQPHVRLLWPMAYSLVIAAALISKMVRNSWIYWEETYFNHPAKFLNGIPNLKFLKPSKFDNCWNMY